ncbi:MAG: hypothetical protein ACRD2L_04520, partial [Terriglobia bacterium]
MNPIEPRRIVVQDFRRQRRTHPAMVRGGAATHRFVVLSMTRKERPRFERRVLLYDITALAMCATGRPWRACIPALD